MGYLNHRFSNLTSLIMLLVLTIGTTWMFHFATQVNTVAEGWLDYSVATYDANAPKPHLHNRAQPSAAASATQDLLGN